MQIPQFVSSPPAYHPEMTAGRIEEAGTEEAKACEVVPDLLPVGTRVRHRPYGLGKIVAVDPSDRVQTYCVYFNGGPTKWVDPRLLEVIPT